MSERAWTLTREALRRAAKKSKAYAVERGAVAHPIVQVSPDYLIRLLDELEAAEAALRRVQLACAVMSGPNVPVEAIRAALLGDSEQG